MKTCRIVQSGSKNNIEYYVDDVLETVEFFPAGAIPREGYTNVAAPNWNGLTQSLWGSSLMGFAFANATPNGFSLSTKSTE
jgi:hypothetical protein